MLSQADTSGERAIRLHGVGGGTILTGRREYPSAPIVGVGAVVIEGDRVLLVRRGHEPRMGEWSIPGGAVEVGETLEQAVVREVREETGLTVVPRVLLKAFDRIDRDAEDRVRYHYVLIDFLCVLAPGVQPAPHAASDASDLRWVAGATLGSSKEFSLPDWTLDVIEAGWRHVQQERRMQQEQGQPASP